jgi:hypothetical protein
MRNTLKEPKLTNEKLAELCLEELTHLNKQALLEELENLLLSLAERGFDLKLLHTYYIDKVSQGQNSYKF